MKSNYPMLQLSILILTISTNSIKNFTHTSTPDPASNYIVFFQTPETPDKDLEQKVYADNYIRIQSLFQKDDKIISKFTNGYIAKMSESTKDMVENDPSVAIVERDMDIHIADSPGGIYDVKPMIEVLTENRYYFEKSEPQVLVQNKAPWGISRLSSGRHKKSGMQYRYPSKAGEGIDVYVIDTGIEIGHSEFEGNAKWGINLVEGSADEDEHGHGTHCSGTIGGKTMGIAKKANLIAVKVLDKQGQGKISRVILGIDFVIKSHEKKKEEIDSVYRKMFLNRKVDPKHYKPYDNPFDNGFGNMFNNPSDDSEEEFEYKVSKNDKKDLNKTANGFLKYLTNFLEIEEIKPKSVVNMSVGGLRSRALNFGIDYASKLGIHFSVAAGNDHEDACLFSPGSSRNALTVGASTRDDTVAFFSNIGQCVDVYAPGMEITSSWIHGQTKVASGTSMAAPHVSGVMALYLSTNDYSPSELRNTIIKDSYNVIEGDDESDGDMLDFWPVKYFFGKEKDCYPLVSIKKLNQKVEHEAD